MRATPARGRMAKDAGGTGRMDGPRGRGNPGRIARAIGLTLLVASTAPGQAPRPATPDSSIPAAEAPPVDGDRSGGAPPGSMLFGGMERVLPLPFAGR